MAKVRGGTGTRGVLGAIGNTPLVQLQRLPRAGSARVFVKLEYLNPSGSVKDRAALATILDAEKQGILSPGSTVIEASGGNMGHALALVGAAKGYRVIVVMPSDVPEEHKRRLLAYGAELVESPLAQGMAGALAAAKQLAREHPQYSLLDQFSNPACVRAHRETTAREILSALDRPVDAFVAGVGTGATLTGIGEALKAKNPATAVIAVEPAASPMLSQGKSGSHRIIGIGANFVPPLLNRQMLDQILQVSDEKAYQTAALLARQEGLLVGPSSGANVAAALKVASLLEEGRIVVTVLPDGGERHLRLLI